MVRQLTRVLGASVVVAAAACAPATVNGTIDGAGMSVTNATATLSTDGGTSSVGIALSEFDPDAEEYSASELEGKAYMFMALIPANAGDFEVVSFDSLTGGGTIPERFANVFFSRGKDVRCEDGVVANGNTILSGSAGTVTLENDPVVGEDLTGSFELTIGEDEITGSFSLPVDEFEEPAEDDSPAACVD